MQVDERPARAQFDHDENGQEGEASDARGHDHGRGPRLEWALGHAEHEEPKTGAAEDEPWYVEPAGVDSAGTLEEQPSEDNGGDTDGEVHEEDPAPGQARH